MEDFDIPKSQVSSSIFILTEGKALHMSQIFSLQMAVGRHEAIKAGWISKTKQWKEDGTHYVGSGSLQSAAEKW